MPLHWFGVELPLDSILDDEVSEMPRTSYFNRVAVSKDPLLFTAGDLPKIERLRQRLGDLTGCRVLEPGCGAGPLTEHLSQWVGPEGRVMAFDSSPGMVGRCSARLKHARNVLVREGRVEDWDAAQGAWDLILLFRVFPHFQDQPAVLERLRSFLAPSGRLVICHLDGSAGLNAQHAGYEAAVQRDRIPGRAEMWAMLESAGYEVLDGLDEDGDYFFSARWGLHA